MNDRFLPTFRVLAEGNQVKVHTLSHCLNMQTCRWGEDRRTVGYTLVSIFVGSAENCFDVGHRGPELCCCFEESESDCNGPPCAPACLPLRFTTHLIRSAGKKKSTAHSAHTHFKPRLSLLSHRLSFSLFPLIPPLLYCVLVASTGFYYSCIHSLTGSSYRIRWVFFSLVKTPNDAHENKVIVLPLIVF